jgi:hypothetical protein
MSLFFTGWTTVELDFLRNFFKAQLSRHDINIKITTSANKTATRICNGNGVQGILNDSFFVTYSISVSEVEFFEHGKLFSMTESVLLLPSISGLHIASPVFESQPTYVPLLQVSEQILQVSDFSKL